MLFSYLLYSFLSAVCEDSRFSKEYLFYSHILCFFKFFSVMITPAVRENNGELAREVRHGQRIDNSQG